MIVLLLIVIAGLLGIVIYLNVAFYNEKRRFRSKVRTMHKIIAENTLKQSGQLAKLKLSDDLNETLKSRQHTLSEAIFKLSYALFEQLSKNKSDNS